MINFSNFSELDNFVQDTRKEFRDRVANNRNDSARAISLCYKLTLSIPELVDVTEREEYKAKIVAKIMQMVLGIAYLSESGFYNLVGPFLRNYVELFGILVAIGFDDQCYIDWKNGRDQISGFGKVIKRIEGSDQVPKEMKDFAPFLNHIWAKSSSLFSHQLTPEAVKDGFSGEAGLNIGISRASEDDQTKRLNLVTVLCLNLATLFIRIFNYVPNVKRFPKKFPEASDLLAVYKEMYEKYLSEQRIG